MEVFILPSLFTVSGYTIFFWSGDMNEPIHVHISKGHPTKNATKIWLTKSGGCIISNNNSHIPTNELNELLMFISAQFFYICNEWKRFFVIDKIKFYC